MDLATYFGILKNGTEYKYEYGLIDFQYIIMRDKNMLAGNIWGPYNKYWTERDKEGNRLHLDEEFTPLTERLTKGYTLKVILQSIMKLKREHHFKYPMLFLDSSPYHKVKAIQDYKADRYIPTQERLDEIAIEKMREGITKEELRDLEIEEQKIMFDKDNFEVQQAIKYGFLNQEWTDAGFTVIIKKGYEADDLAYLTAKKLSDRGIKAILLTADKDWVNFKMPGIDFISTYTFHSYPKLDEEWEASKIAMDEMNQKLYGEPSKITRYEYGILCEISGYTHNYASVWLHYDVDWFEFACKILNQDSSLVDYAVARYAFEAMNMNIGIAKYVDLDESGNPIAGTEREVPYIDDTANLINFKLNQHAYKKDVFANIMQTESIDYNFSTYDTFVGGLDLIE